MFKEFKVWGLGFRLRVEILRFPGLKADWRKDFLQAADL